MSTYAERKAERRLHYELHVKGRKMVICAACNGSGRYDHDGAPNCSSCNGTGKVRETLWDALAMSSPDARRNGIVPKLKSR